MEYTDSYTLIKQYSVREQTPNILVVSIHVCALNLHNIKRNVQIELGKQISTLCCMQKIPKIKWIEKAKDKSMHKNITSKGK